MADEEDIDGMIEDKVDDAVKDAIDNIDWDDHIEESEVRDAVNSAAQDIDWGDYVDTALIESEVSDAVSNVDAAEILEDHVPDAVQEYLNSEDGKKYLWDLVAEVFGAKGESEFVDPDDALPSKALASRKRRRRR